jgi:hypothetical protein
VTRHHAHVGNRMVMAVGAVVVIACAAGIAAAMVRILGATA